MRTWACAVLLVGAFSSPNAVAQRYGARPLPHTPGQSSGTFYPRGLNRQGWIVGQVYEVGGALWLAGVTYPLPFPNAPQTSAIAINDSNVVAGAYQADGVSYAVLWDDSVVSEIGIASGPVTISNAGHVVFRDRVWLDGDVTQLDAPRFSALAANSHGVLCGPWNRYYPLCPSYLERAARWADGVLTDLGSLGGCQSFARDIDDSSRIVGWADYVPGGQGEFESQHAVLWDGDAIIDLGTLGGFGSRAWAINNRQQIVGMSLTSRGDLHAFIHDSARMHDIHDLMPPDIEPYIRWIYGFNDAGQLLVEIAEPPHGDAVSYLLTPRPCYGFATCDMNCDGTINQFDIQPFLMAQADPIAWSFTNPRCNYYCVADTNEDGSVNQFDIESFIDCLMD